MITCPLFSVYFHFFFCFNHFGFFLCFSRPYVHFHLLSSVFPSSFTFILDFFPAFLGLMSIFTCLFLCFSPASQSFWTFFLLFSPLCPFSPALFRFSLWLIGDFGLFSCFSLLYVHSHLPVSTFHSGFTFILDFFPAFLCFMSILTCSVQCFSLDSRSFWIFSLFFSLLCPYGRILKTPDCEKEKRGRLRTAKSCTDADKKVSDHTLFVPKAAFPTAISRTGRT